MQSLLAETRQEVAANRSMLDSLTGAASTALYSRAHYTPIKPAQAVHASTARFVAMCAGVRSGKTYAAAHLLLERIEADYKAGKERLWYWCVAPTYDLSDVQREYLEEALFNADVDFDYNAQKHRLRITSHGVTIWFKSADRDKNLRARGIRGVWVSEAAAVKEGIWDSRIYSRLSDLGGWGILESSPEGHNWFYRFCQQSPQFAQSPGDDNDIAYFHWTTSDNNAVPNLAKEAQAAKRRLPDAIWRREYNASFDAFQGQIYTEWDAGIHVYGPDNKLGILGPPETYPEVMYGFDPAFGHAAAFVAIIRDGSGTYWQVDEAVAPEILPDYWGDIAVDMVKKWGHGVVHCDPSSPIYRKIFESRGLIARKAYNEVKSGVSQVATALHLVDGKPGMLFGPNCPQTIKELPQQRWGPDEKPIKKQGHDDDCADANRYAIARKGVTK